FATTEHGHVILRDTLPSGGTQPVFFALPQCRPSLDDSLDGSLRCILKTAGGGEFETIVDLQVKGERVSGKASGGVVVGPGVFKDGKLRLEMQHQENAYDFTAALTNGRVAGQWEGKDDQATGTWSADRLDTTRAEEKCTAVVPPDAQAGPTWRVG